jgi:hypothetical protein
MPDAVHVFKNVAGSLTSGHRFYLDQRTVDAYKLPSSEISLVPIKQVFELDKGDVLKLCPRLKANVISPNHFEKMNTSLSVALLSHDVAAAILYQISAKNIEAKHQTTAWFLMLMQKWFKLMTSRSQNMAMSNANPKEHDAAITFFHTFMEIVTNLKTNDNVWKPFQAGLLLSTQAALDLQHIYLNKENFRYIMLGRLTQDALENLFSMIRSRSSAPDARDFKCALRMVCLSQFEGKINNSSYAHADTDHLVKYCDSLNSSVSNEEQEDQTDDNHLEILGFSYDESLISDHVKEALYNFLGSSLHKIKKNKKTCDECYNTLIIKDHEEYLGVGTFTRLREYKNNNLCYVNGQIFNFMIECEFAFRSHENLLMKNEVSTKDVVAILLKSKNLPPTPNCHNIMYLLLESFVKSRRYFSLRESNAQHVHSSLGKDSRSVAMKSALARK